MASPAVTPGSAGSTGRSGLRRWLIGEPLPTSAHAEERLSNGEALAILSSDALSSVAYASQEILLVLSLAGAAALSLSVPITGLIVALMLVVAISYRQTIKAYPHGGGSYRVSHDNLGVMPGLVAGASLAIDYVLTVSVSVAAGIAAITSLLPQLAAERIPLCLLAVALLMLVNLRGVRSSARLLSLPTFLFMGLVLTLVVLGLAKLRLGLLPPLDAADQARQLAQVQGGELAVLGPVLLMRAFSSGCAALTGIEAISDSVMVFKPVEWRNARLVLTGMVIVLAVMFSGISVLASQLGLVYVENGPTLLYQLGERIFANGLLLSVLQLSTLLILLLAANTAYADFPRLSAFLAQDGYMPRQLASLGDRLVFSNGIALLSGFATVLLLVFDGSVTRLIPLYAVGVFTSFTLSQAGMVVHWWKEQRAGWLFKALVNGFGSLVTGVVCAVLLYSKFRLGAWVIVVAVPLLVTLLLTIKAHYRQVARRLRLAPEARLHLPEPLREGGSPVVLLVGQLHRGSYEALRYARTIADTLVAVHVDLGDGRAAAFQEQWQRQLPEVELVILPSPYRSLIEPVKEFIQRFESEQRQGGERFCTVVLPVFVTRQRWQNLLHNQSTYFLRQALRREGTRVVTTVGFYL
ncbi:APC family permease [Synechococcus sp. CBW1107]|uniref:APC family permease n=1 Tax=Synechococcus sp. CBW1107 TaxID=2789857 RepID=UPI002AD40BD4|nr:APC family permease [Synechococcus sp. CBW1107]CAK6699735.1 Potassium transporter KimA [Synechococcus sp. CBW1107]